MLQERTGIPVKLQMLIHGGKVVSPEISLTSQSFVHGSSVFVHIRSKGGGKTRDHSGLDCRALKLNFCLIMARVVRQKDKHK